jgi:murein DD-endopeptidase MepM/ murein hydrolase activator NlpD
MKKTLKEQLERIHTLTYGKKVIKEGFLDDLFGKKDVDEQSATDSKKSDVVGKDNQGKQIDDSKLVDDFYNTFDKAISSGGLKQQNYGSMAYQKEVESMQIGLMLLGYDLPKYGVDGLFGPETSQTVQKFGKDNNIDVTSPSSGKTVNESVRKIKIGLLEVALDSPLDSTSINSPFGTRWGGQGHNGVDLKADASNVKAPADGVVEVGEIKNDACGGTIIINHAGGFKTGFCHMQKINVTAGQQIKQGDIIGVSGGGSNDVGHGKSDGRHLHFTLRKDGQIVDPMDYIDKSGIVMTGGIKQSSQSTNISATPELLTKLLELVKGKNLTPQTLRQYMNKVIRGNNATIDVKDWQGIVNTIINNLEGGYYHPDMLQDGRVNDSRFGNSGETMFGMDRQAGGTESQGPAGQEFWRLIDAEDARHKWKHEYMLKDNPQLDNKLRQLVAEIMQPLFVKYVHSYLSPDAAPIVTSDSSLTFNFAYAVWNGPGWFQKFAKPINDAVASGTTDPKQLLQIALERRTGSGNSLIAQGGSKVASIANRISSSQPSTATIA